MRQLGVELDRLEANALLETVRGISQRNKRPLSDGELLALCRSARKVA